MKSNLLKRIRSSRTKRISKSQNEMSKPYKWAKRKRKTVGEKTKSFWRFFLELSVIYRTITVQTYKTKNHQQKGW